MHKNHGRTGPLSWFKLFQQFVQEKNVTPEEIHEMSKECGHEMSVETIKEKLAKMPEWIKMGEAWKDKMAGGNCGNMGGMMGECMKKFMASKCGEEMKAKCGGQGFNPAEMMKNFANCQNKQTEQKEQTEQTEEKKSEEGAQQKTFNPMEMMNKFLNSEGGADMKTKCEQNGFNPAEMMQKFMGGNADKECKPEDMMAMGQKFMGMMGGKGCGEWKNKRAKAVNNNHENPMAILPGQTQFAEIEVQNGTQWPWKQGCFFGMDDAKHGDEETNMPVEPVRVEIPFNVAGNQNFKLTIPFTVHGSFPASANEHKVHMSFRGPQGNTFGERFTFKVIVAAPEVAEQIDEM